MNDFREYSDYFMHYGGVAYGRDLNLLDSKERMDIINKDLASVTSRQGERNLYYRDTYRSNNYLSKRRNLKHGINDFRDVHEDYLMHFGILGMKWGIRRYQNPDGTLTEAGKKRYDRLNARANLAEGYTKDLKDMQQAYKEGTLKKSHSDKEIQKYSEFAKKLRQKAEKYGTETREDRAKRNKQAALERNKQKIEEANKIDLEDVFSKIPFDEVADKWENDAKDKDKYDLDFLEITQNNYDDMPEEAKRKQMLKDYSDYLTCDRVNKMIVNKRDRNTEEAKKDLKDSADLGLKAYQKMGWDRGEPGDPSQREWFIYEDQTIGDVEVADLCKKMKREGYNKYAVINAINSINNDDFIDIFGQLNNSESLWDLDYYRSYHSGSDGKISKDDKYINAIWAILESEGKINHSAVDEIFEKFGII